MTAFTYARSQVPTERLEAIPWVQNINKQDGVFALCMKVERVVTMRRFRAEVINNDLKVNQTSLWTTPVCEPQYLALTRSPVFHLLVENPTDNMKFIVELKSFFKDRFSNEWVKVINGKSSEGHTALDYIEAMKRGRHYLPTEAQDVEKLTRMLCDDGAVYSLYDVKCYK